MQEVSAGNEESTIIIVTHDVSAAVAVSDTIWLMGRERDAEGKIIPGARILEEIDLLARDLAWHPDIRQRPDYLKLVNEIKDRFHTRSVRIAGNEKRRSDGEHGRRRGIAPGPWGPPETAFPTTHSHPSATVRR